MKKIIVDKDSHGTIAINWAVIAILIGCTLCFIHNPYVYIPIIVVLLAFAFFVFWFHRVPDRDIPEGDSKMITSVADGKVVIVDKAYEKEYFQDDRIQVSVYMDFFDVHTNFWPMVTSITREDICSHFCLRLQRRTSILPPSSATSTVRYCSDKLPELSPEGLSATLRRVTRSKEASSAESSNSAHESTYSFRLTLRSR